MDEDSVALVRYEQMLPLWLQKFKKYPKHARLLKLKGKGVIKITIARNGKVIKSQIDKSTGYAILDGAMLDMVEKADPVVPVPVDHLPEMNYLTYKMSVEFLPPVAGLN
jgi:protein TonB